MPSTRRPLLYDDDLGADSQGAWVGTLRFLLRVINLILAVIGCAMIFYAVYIYIDVKKQSSIRGFPWFIFAFGAAGAFVLLTASTALIGVAHNSGFCLGLYSFLMVVLLVAQAALAVAFFADKSWKKLLPRDDTGEARRLTKFLQHELSIVRWIGLAALIVQVLSVLLAYALSSAQQRLLESRSDEEEEVWGRREALPSSHATGSSLQEQSGSAGDKEQRTDPWSVRMRSKYGLDVDSFTYNPASGQRSPQAPVVPTARMSTGESRRCTVM